MKNGFSVIESNPNTRAASLCHFCPKRNEKCFNTFPLYIRANRLFKDRLERFAIFGIKPF